MSNELIELTLAEADESMTKAVDHARHEFATVRTGRPNPAIVEKIMVNYHGTDVPLQQLASFTVPEAQLLIVSPYDKTAIDAIDKAIHNTDLGVNPSNDGHVIRLNFPPLTEERRRDMVKMVRAMAEDGKIALRNTRRSCKKDLDALGKDGDASDDDISRAEKELDQLIHAREADINGALAQKEAELLEV